jgi:hypothetical protein
MRGSAVAVRNGGYVFAGVVFACVWLVLCWPWLSGHVTIPWDAKAHFYPQLVFLAKSLASGQSPFWTPNVFDGWPQIADPQSLIFSPIYFLAALSGPAPGFQLADGVLFFMLALGAFGVILYFRDRGWRAEGALVAAIAFVFGGSAAWRIQHVGQVMSLAWFPLAFFALSRALDRGSVVWGAAAGALAAFMALGRDQIAWFGLLFFVAFVMFRLFGAPGLAANARRFVKPLAGGFVAGGIVAGLPVAFTAALALDSNRPELIYSEVVKGSLHPASFLTLIVPNLFGVDGPLKDFWGPPSQAWGVTDLFLARNMGEVYLGALALVALAAGWRLRGIDRDARFLLAAAIVFLLYALGRYTPAFGILFHLPGADLWRRPADATFPLCALGAYLAGYCIHRLSSGEARWRPVIVAVAMIAAVAICAVVAVAKGRIEQATYPILLATVMLAGAVALIAFLARNPKRSPHMALALIGLFCVADFATGAGPNESTALPPANFDMLRPGTANPTITLLRDKLAGSAAPDRRDRVELAGIGFDWPNASLSQGFDHDLGYNPLRLSLFERFTNAEDHLALPEQRTFSKAFPSYRSIAADLTGLRYIATGVPAERIDPGLKPGDLTLIARTPDAYVYENPRAFPRVFLATAARAANFDAILDQGQWPDVDYRTTVLLRAGGDETARRPGTATLARYANTEIDVDVSAPDGGWLVLTDAYHPWWNVTVDGAPAELLQADVMFRAVRVSPGAHRVAFRFAPFAGLWRQVGSGVARTSATP